MSLPRIFAYLGTQMGKTVPPFQFQPRFGSWVHSRGIFGPAKVCPLVQSISHIASKPTTTEINPKARAHPFSDARDKERLLHQIMDVKCTKCTETS